MMRGSPATCPWTSAVTDLPRTIKNPPLAAFVVPFLLAKFLFCSWFENYKSDSKICFETPAIEGLVAAEVSISSSWYWTTEKYRLLAL